MKTAVASIKTQLTILRNGRRTCEITGPVPGRKPGLAPLMRLLWAAALVLPLSGAQAGVALTTLHSFQVFNNGAQPSAGLVQGSDGSLFGTTVGENFFTGGTRGFGTVFKISTNGAETSLYSFTGGGDGASPYGLVQGSDGNFYGTTIWGGTNGGWGTVFKISTTGALSSLYSFTGGNDGAYPNGLLQGSDGSFYGTSSGGGMYPGPFRAGYGTVFKISTNGAMTSLYSFPAGSHGVYPFSGNAFRVFIRLKQIIDQLGKICLVL
jgi:uncharacterized repeat protein (TIGR03803 family)